MRLCDDCGGFLSATGDCRRCITREEQLKSIEIVPNDLLRSRYLELQAHEERGRNDRVCLHMASRGYRHYLRSTRNGDRRTGTDPTHLKRRIGVYAYSDGRTKQKNWVRYLPYEEAVELCRAMNMEPHEAGV